MSESKSCCGPICSWFEENVYALIDRELDSAEQEKALQHLQACESCKALHQEALSLNHDLSGMSAMLSPSEHAWDRFQERLVIDESLDLDVVIPAQAAPVLSLRTLKTHWSTHWASYSLAAAAAVLFVVGNSIDQDKSLQHSSMETALVPAPVSGTSFAARPVDSDVSVAAAEVYQFRQVVEAKVSSMNLASLDSGSGRVQSLAEKNDDKLAQVQKLPTLSEVAVTDEALNEMMEIALSETERFLMDRFPVTNREYARFVSATGHRTPFHWAGGTHTGIDRDGLQPVTYVSWDDADAFCRWEGKTLPTSSQFEKAGHGLVSLPATSINVKESGLGLLPVGALSGNVSGFGVSDLVGNVRHWVKDDAQTNGFPGLAGRNKMQKGASFLDSLASASVKTAHGQERETIPGHTGFRCAR